MESHAGAICPSWGGGGASLSSRKLRSQVVLIVPVTFLRTGTRTGTSLHCCKIFPETQSLTGDLDLYFYNEP